MGWILDKDGLHPLWTTLAEAAKACKNNAEKIAVHVKRMGLNAHYVLVMADVMKKFLKSFFESMLVSYCIR